MILLLVLASKLLIVGDVVPTPNLREVVECVRSNEALYKNIKYNYQDYYVLDDRATAMKVPIFTKSSAVKKSYYQKDRSVRLIEYINSVGVSGRSSNRSFETISDGSHVFKIANETHVNLVVDPPGPRDYLHVHSLLGKDKLFLDFPLSEYIQGGSELKKYKRMKNFDVESKVLGIEKIDDETCVKVLVEITDRYPNGRIEWDRVTLWLAIAKNYLPVRFDGRASRVDGELTCEGRVERFDQIDQGVWFPVKMVVLTHDEFGYPKTHQSPVVGEQRIEITNVELNPKYPDHIFEDRKIPIGAVVYKLKDNKIIEKYKNGLNKIKPIAKRRSVSSWTIGSWIAAAIVGLIFGVIVAISIVRNRRAARLAS
jgi:hypothetical protein